MNKTRFATRILLAGFVAALATSSAVAQLQWDPVSGGGAQGGSGDWTTSNGGSPWWNGTTNVAWTDGSDASFTTGFGAVTATGVIVDDISFSSGIVSYTLSGSLTLGMGDGIHTIASSGNFDTTISASLAGTGELVKIGTGKVILSGANTFTGPTSINEGTLVLSGGNPISAGDSIAIGTGATLEIDPFFSKTIGSLTGTGSLKLSSQLTTNGNNASTAFGGTISGGGGGSLVKAGAGTLTLSGSLTFGGAVTVNGGTLTLTGANSFGGATTINNGTLEAAGGNAIPDGSSVTVGASALLRLLNNETVNSLNGSGFVELGTNTLTITGTNDGSFSGAISGSGSLIKSGAGTLTLSGTNSFSGGVSVNNGTVAVPDFGSSGVNGPLGPGPVTLNGGNLQYSGTGASTTARPFLIESGGGRFSAGTGQLTLTGLLTGSGAVTIGGGTVTLTNSGNSFTGGIKVAGTLSLSEIPDNAANSTLGATGPITFNGGRLLFTGSGNDSSNRPLIFDASSEATIEVVAGASLALGGASGTGSLNKAGLGTLILTDPTSSFSGRVLISNGILLSGPLADSGLPSALGAGNSIEFGQAGQLNLPAGVNGSTNRTISVYGSGRIKISNSVITLNGAMLYDGTLTFAGDDAATDTFILNTLGFGSLSQSRIQGRTVIDRTTVRVAGGVGLPAKGRVELTDNTGARLEILIPTFIGSLQGGAGPNQGRVTLNASLTTGADNTDSTFAGILEGNGGLIIKGATIGAGTVNLTGPNTFTGNVLIDGGGRLAVSDVANAGTASSLGAGSVLVMGQNVTPPTTLIFLGDKTDSTNRSMQIQGGGAHLNVANTSGTLIWSGPIDGNVSNSPDTTVTKEGAGTLRFTGVNSYVGSTAIKAGKLQVLGGSALPNSGRVSIFAGATLELLAGTNETIGSLEGDGSLQLGGQRLITGLDNLASTYSGQISGTGESQIEKQGGGNFTLTSLNSSFTGGILISEGAVTVPLVANAGVNSPIGSNGSIVLGDSTHTGRLIVTGSQTSSTNRPVSVSSGGGIVDVSNTSTEVGLSGSISGAAPLIKLGSGRLKLQGDKTFSGSLIVADGTLRLDGNLPNARFTLFNPGVLDSSDPAPRAIGALTVSGGTVSLGLPNSPGSLNTADLSLESGMLAIDLTDATDTGYDHINVTGGVALTGTIDLDIHVGFDPEDRVDVFRIIVNDGTDVTQVGDASARLSYGGWLLEEGNHFLVQDGSISQYFEIHYGLTSDDNDIRLFAVPEPCVSSSYLLGGIALLLRRPRKAV